jgi:hypothetical protein
MKTFLVRLTGLGLAALTAGTASAASPAYCALYAREYANQMVDVGASAKVAINLQDQAYYRCLNQDEDPALPTASAYFGSEVENPAPARSLATIAKGKPSPSDTKRASGGEASPPQKASLVAATSSGGRSRGLVRWSPQWVAKCKKYYPNSFDPKTGTVLPYHASSRRMCPY